MGISFGGKQGDCPITEKISDQLTRLPMYFDLSNSQLEQIVDAITSFTI
jgi:dTDP-4-amino-4,6-dideoxygalactose transaminase